MINWLMDKFGKFADFMGQGKSWMVGEVRVYLWPLTTLALAVLVLFAVDKLFY